MQIIFMLPTLCQRCNSPQLYSDFGCIDVCPVDYLRLDNIQCIENSSCKLTDVNVCVSSCTLPKINITNSCTIKYGSYVLNGTKVDSCPLYYFELDNYKFCTSKCLPNQYLLASQCINCQPQFAFNNACSTSCPSGYKKFNFTCVATCPPETNQFEDQCLYNMTNYIGISGNFITGCTDFRNGSFCTKTCSVGANSHKLCEISSEFVQNGIYVESCPDKSQGQFCVNSCTGEYGDDGTAVCTKSNPNYLLKNVWVVSCPESSKFIQGKNCLEECGYGFASHGSNFCFSSSPEVGFEFIQDLIWVENCDTGKLIQGNQCVDSCSGEFGLFNGNCLNTPPSADLLLFNNNWVSICPSPFVKQQFKCQAQCDANFGQKNFICTNNIPNEFIEDGNWVSACSSGKFQHGNQCLQTCPDGFGGSNSLCISSPPVDFYIVINGIWSSPCGKQLYQNGICLPECATGYQPDSNKQCQKCAFYDPILKICTDSCQIYDKTGLKCVQNCTGCEQKINVEISGKLKQQCVLTCLGGQFIEDGHCVDSCKYSDGIFCVEKCSEGQFIDGNQCVKNCSSKFYIIEPSGLKTCVTPVQCKTFKSIVFNADFNASECINECPFLINLVENQLNCTNFLPNGQFFTKKPQTIFGQISNSCPSLYVIQTHECVTACPINTFFNETAKICQPNCSKFIQVDKVNQVRQCVESCQFNFNEDRICENTCDLPLLSGQCTSNCVGQHDGICYLTADEFDNVQISTKSPGCMQLFGPVMYDTCKASNFYYDFRNSIINVVNLIKSFNESTKECQFSVIDFTNSTVENVIFVVNITDLPVDNCLSTKVSLFGNLINSTLKNIYITGNINLITTNLKLSATALNSQNSSIVGFTDLKLNQNDADKLSLQSINGFITITPFVPPTVEYNQIQINLFENYKLSLVYDNKMNIEQFVISARKSLNSSWYLNSSVVPCYAISNQFCFGKSGKLDELCIGNQCSKRSLNTSCNVNNNQLYFGMQCLNSCPDGYVLFKFKEIGFCMMECPINYNNQGGVCVCLGVIYQDKCMLKCPDGYLQIASGCQANCLQLNGICVDTCPVGYKQVLQICEIETTFNNALICSTGQLYQAGQCVSECENAFEYNKQCLPCYQGGLDIETNTCSGLCLSNVCLPKCLADQSINYQDLSCIQNQIEIAFNDSTSLLVCLAPQWNLNQQCVDECPFNYLELKDASYRLCSPYCQNSNYNQSNVCQNSCDKGNFTNDYNVCVDNCSFVVENRKCVSKCSYMMYLIDDINCRNICPNYITDSPLYIFEQLNTNSQLYNIEGQCSDNCSFEPNSYVVIRDNMKQCMKCDLFSTSDLVCLSNTNISRFCNSMTFTQVENSSVGYVLYKCNDGNCVDLYNLNKKLKLQNNIEIYFTQCVKECPNYINITQNLCVDSCFPKANADNICIQACLTNQPNFIMSNQVCENQCSFVVNQYNVDNYMGYFCEVKCRKFYKFQQTVTIQSVQINLCQDKCYINQVYHNGFCKNRSTDNVIYSENKTCQEINCFGDTCLCFDVQLDTCLPPFFIIDNGGFLTCTSQCPKSRYIEIFKDSKLIYQQCIEKCPDLKFVNRTNYCVSLNSINCKTWALSEQDEYFCDVQCGNNSLVSYPYTYYVDTLNPRCTDLCVNLQPYYPTVSTLVLKNSVCLPYTEGLCVSIQIQADYKCLDANECPTSTTVNSTWSFGNTPQCPSCKKDQFATDQGCVQSCPEPYVGDMMRGVCVLLQDNQYYKIINGRKILAPLCTVGLKVCCATTEFVTIEKQCISTPNTALKPYQGGICDSYIIQDINLPKICINCTYALQKVGQFYQCKTDCQPEYFNSRTRICQESLVSYTSETQFATFYGEEIKRNVRIIEMSGFIGIILVLCALLLILIAYLVVLYKRRHKNISFVDYRVKGIVISNNPQNSGKNHQTKNSLSDENIFQLA